MATIRWYDYVLLCKKYDYEVNHKSQQCQPPSVKICIGYVLKSADIGTLFSNRYCILKIHPTHTHTCRLPRTFTHTCTHSGTLAHTPTHTCAYQQTPVHTRGHQRTPVHTRAYPCTLAHTCAHHTYPLMSLT